MSYISNAALKIAASAIAAFAVGAIATTVSVNKEESQKAITTKTNNQIENKEELKNTELVENNISKKTESTEEAKKEDDEEVESVSGEVIYDSAKTVDDKSVEDSFKVDDMISDFPATQEPKEKFVFHENIDDLINKIESGINIITTNIEKYELDIIVPTILFWDRRIEFDQLFARLENDVDKMYANTISQGLVNLLLSDKIGTIDDTMSICNIELLRKAVYIISEGYPADKILQGIRNNIDELYNEYQKRVKNDAYYKLRNINVWPVLSSSDITKSPTMILYGRNRYYKLEELFQDIIRPFEPINHVFVPYERNGIARKGIVELYCSGEINGVNQSCYVKIDEDGSIEGTPYTELFATWTDNYGNNDEILVPIKDLGKGSYSITSGPDHGYGILMKILNRQNLNMNEVHMILENKDQMNSRVYRSIDFTGVTAPNRQQYEKLRPIEDFIYSLDIPAMVHSSGTIEFPNTFTIDSIRFRVADYNWDKLDFTLVSDEKVNKQIEDFDSMNICQTLTIKCTNGIVSVYLSGLMITPLIQKGDSIMNQNMNIEPFDFRQIIQ